MTLAIESHKANVVANASNIINLYVKKYCLRSLEKVSEVDLKAYYCTCGYDCYYYKMYMKNINVQQVPVYPALLGSTLMESKPFRITCICIMRLNVV